MEVIQTKAHPQCCQDLLLLGQLVHSVKQGSFISPLHNEAQAVVLEGGEAKEADHIGMLELRTEVGLPLEVLFFFRFGLDYLFNIGSLQQLKFAQ